MIAAAVWAFDAWLERRSIGRTIVLGLAVGGAVATKLSAVGFLPAALAPLAVASWIRRRREPADARAGELRRDVAILAAAATAFLLVWSLFFFSIGPLVQPERTPPPDDTSPVASLLRTLARVPVPAPELFWGFQELGHHSEIGHLAYLRGETSMHGWAAYFPIAIAVKTPIPFLILALAGLGAALARARRDPLPLALALGALGVLAVGMTSAINIGIRHILPIYPLLAVVAGVSVGHLFLPSPRREPNPERPESEHPGRGAGGEGPAPSSRENAEPRTQNAEGRNPPARSPFSPLRSAFCVLRSIFVPEREDRVRPILAGIAVLLIAWQLFNAVSAHPDHLAWFNEIADDQPEAWLLDSNLDWGQDLLRLEEAARRHGIESLALSYFGSALPQRHDLPELRPAHPIAPSAGWVAVSRMNFHGIGLRSRKPLFRWLEGHEPVEIVGSSILLFHLDEPPGAPPPAEAILLPVLIGPEPLEIAGRSWKTLAISSWRDDEVLWIGIAGKPVAIRPGTHRPAEFERTALSGLLVVLPEREAPKLHFDVLLREVRTSEIVPLPVVRGARVPEGAFRIEGFSAEPRGRSLRLYDLARIPGGRARVALLRGGREVASRTVELSQPEPTGPYFHELDLATLGFRPGDAVEIAAASEGMRLWAMAVETDPATGGIGILEP